MPPLLQLVSDKYFCSWGNAVWPRTDIKIVATARYDTQTHQRTTVFLQKLATCQIHSWLPCGCSSFQPAHFIGSRCIVQRRRHSTCRPVSQILWLCSYHARTRHPDLQATPGPDKRHSTTYCTSRTSIEIQSSSDLVVPNGDRSRRSPHL